MAYFCEYSFQMEVTNICSPKRETKFIFYKLLQITSINIDEREPRFCQFLLYKETIKCLSLKLSWQSPWPLHVEGAFSSTNPEGSGMNRKWYQGSTSTPTTYPLQDLGQVISHL